MAEVVEVGEKNRVEELMFVEFRDVLDLSQLNQVKEFQVEATVAHFHIEVPDGLLDLLVDNRDS